MIPIIGMLAEVDDEKKSAVLNTYIAAIEKAGGLPLLLPYVEEESVIARFIEACDGFFFTGGRDIDPRRYGEEVICADEPTQLFRDELDFKVMKSALKTEKPILCVCRGAQLLNVALSGNLYQDIPTQRPSELFHRQKEPKLSPSHSVKIIESTPLSRLIGADTMSANSFHHQAIKELGRGLRVMALAEDGIVEAVYFEGERYIRAYQWHPERLAETDGDNRLLFEDFVSACINSSSK